DDFELGLCRADPLPPVAGLVILRGHYQQCGGHDRPPGKSSRERAGLAQVRPIALGLPFSLKLNAASQTAILPSRIFQTSTPRPVISLPVTASRHSPSP